MPTTDQDASGDSSINQMPRRRIVKALVAMPAGIIAWRAQHALARPSASAPASAQPSSASIDPSFAAALSRRLPIAFRDHPLPRYLPAGHRLGEVFTDAPDGFGLGSEELAFRLVNVGHPLGSNCPTTIYVARRPQKGLGCTELRAGRSLTLETGTSAVVPAEYHDGFWVPSPREDGSSVWETRNAHSVVFTVGHFSVGVRGSRLSGVDFDELMRIAASVR